MTRELIRTMRNSTCTLSFSAAEDLTDVWPKPKLLPTLDFLFETSRNRDRSFGRTLIIVIKLRCPIVIIKSKSVKTLEGIKDCL